MNTLELFEAGNAGPLRLDEGITLLRGFADTTQLFAIIEAIAVMAPFRHLVTPGGQTMSVAMTNCGPVGWVSDRSGYRYSSRDPQTDRDWPRMPPEFMKLALEAARAGGFPEFVPDACLINRYAPGARLTAHRDADEQNLSQPIVSVSIGLPASFAFYGLARGGKGRTVSLTDGDVLVWGGPARLVYHAVRPVKPGNHPLTGEYRYNLTFRHAR
ncbi:MAG TPA: DNA oxidative demethylase AlkB [Steroidobacteraceae bacterium]|nr:DNA oxidative demethylase AlkB [Steroidobacteraceae bacterium]